MNIQVIGAGSWGLALARVLVLNGHDVRVCCREEDNPDALRETRESPTFLPGVKIPESIGISLDSDPEADMVVLAVPSHVMRHVVGAHSFRPDTIRVSVAKGIENETLLRMDEVIQEVCGSVRVVALSGPTHAEEVGRDLPASIVAAGADEAACRAVQDAFRSKTLRVYTSSDIVGVELGGSLKNIVAIAAGVCDGFGLGDNTIAALMTRGLAEMTRLGVAMGADASTFAGLSGMGDLIVTCSSRHSRNRAVGERIAKGMTCEEAVSASPMVAEGVRTTRSAYALAQKHSVDMPITHQVHRVLFEGADPRAAVTELMVRDAKPEKD
jgi:glycerol-3-phosphate dehydrogenase (NAD(P)+)